MVLLDQREYAKLVSEINTNYSKYEGKKYAVHLTYGIDNKAYAYVFKNFGYNDYLFISRDEID